MAISKAFQEKTNMEVGLHIVIPRATKAGCGRCSWSVGGSTCSNPEKIGAKFRAQEVWEKEHGKGEEGQECKYDAKV